MKFTKIIINHIPLWKGQKLKGVKYAPPIIDVMIRNLLNKQDIDIESNLIDFKVLNKPYNYQEISTIINDHLNKTYVNHKSGELIINLGGDHGISVGSIPPMVKKYPELRVLWFDAHADINSIETSLSGNFHGMPVNINGGVNGPTFNSLNKPEPIIKQIEISLTMAYSGCKIPIPIERTIIQNNVKKKENETIYVDVPPGIDDDEAIVIPEKGNILIINQEIKGDIKLFFKIKNNTDFIRNGLDLIYNKEITLKDALCGFSFEMKYIDNKIIKILNNSGNIVTPNYEKKIPKAGIKRDNHIGELIIKFNIKFPDNLTDEQINKLGDIL